MVCDGVAANIVSSTIPYDIGFVQFCGVFWTLVQFSANAIFSIGFVFTQRLSLLMLLLSGYLASGINEYAIKKSLHQSRPAGSCLTTDGFPSGHAVQSVTFCVWIVLEAIAHPGWSLRKRIIIIVTAMVVFLPTGPCRHLLHDHSWTQIGAGMGIGFAWGIIWWSICNFVICRFLYEIMSWRITQEIHLRNDMRPNFERTPNEGKIVVAKHVWTNKFSTKSARCSFARNPVVIDVVHGIFITCGLCIGILGIVLSVIKDHRDPSCDRVAPNVMLVCGILTMITYALWIPLAIMIHRKLTDKDWYPEIVQGLLFASLFFICESSFWAICVRYATYESPNCPANGIDVGVVFLVLYFVFTGLLFAFMIAMYWVVDLRRLYGFKKRSPNGTEINKDEVRNAKEVPKLSEVGKDSPMSNPPA